LHFSNNSSLSL